jgi:hypothetical protein
MRYRTVIMSLVSLALCLGLLSPTLAGGKRRPAPPPMHKADKTEHSEQLTRLQIDAFRVNWTQEQLVKMDFEALTKNKPSASQLFEKLGKENTRLAFRLNQTADISSSFRCKQREIVPAVKDINITGAGKVTPAVNYESVGYDIVVKGDWSPEEHNSVLSLHLGININDVIKSTVELAEGIQLPIDTHIQIDQLLQLKTGEPVYFCSSNTQTGIEVKKTFEVFVVRVCADKL